MKCLKLSFQLGRSPTSEKKVVEPFKAPDDQPKEGNKVLATTITSHAIIIARRV